jgi:hypothetical protein
MLGAGTPRELRKRAARLVLRRFMWLTRRPQPDNAVQPDTHVLFAVRNLNCPS